jgi:hypothetical protein
LLQRKIVRSAYLKQMTRDSAWLLALLSADRHGSAAQVPHCAINIQGVSGEVGVKDPSHGRDVAIGSVASDLQDAHALRVLHTYTAPSPMPLEEYAYLGQMLARG